MRIKVKITPRLLVLTALTLVFAGVLFYMQYGPDYEQLDLQLALISIAGYLYLSAAIVLVLNSFFVSHKSEPTKKD
jgi:hypothetical protein